MEDSNITAFSIGLALLASAGFLYSETHSSRLVSLFILLFLVILIGSHLIFKAFNRKDFNRR